MQYNFAVVDPKKEREKKVLEEADAIKKIARARWLARTNMYFLCNEILGYKDVNPAVHFGLVETLQKFPMPAEEDWLKHDKPFIDETGQLSWKYVPIYPNMLDLPDPWRRRLILDFRGSLKTTVNVMAHSIQWILNYPEVAILVVHAKLDVAQDIISDIRDHFASNEKLRNLFPELCPTEQEAKNFGNRSRFTIPARREVRKEPTVGTSSIESAVAGLHYDVIKMTDCVESENSATKDYRNVIARKFGLYRPVLVSPRYWIDVEGTRYHFDDQYGRILKGERGRPIIEREWKTYVRGCFKKKLPTGIESYGFSEEELDLPDLRINGQRQSWWPDRFPTHILEAMERDPAQEMFEFNSQYRNHPVGDLETADFPPGLIKVIPAETLRSVPIEFYITSVDTAESTNSGSDYSVITTCAWDSNNRAYVVDIKRDRWRPDELIQKIFETYFKWKPISFRIENTAFVRGLKFGMEREMHLKGFSMPLDFVPVDTQRAKIDKIRLTLQPVLKRGDLRFSSSVDQDALDAAMQEFTQFPKGSDDILDTLADQFIGKDYYGRIRNHRTFEDVRKEAFQSLIMGFEEPVKRITYWDATGGL